MTKSVVLFDLDGTLVDSEPLHYASMVSVLHGEGISPPEDLASRITGMTGRDCHALLAAELGFNWSYDAYIKAKYAAYLAASSSLQLRHSVRETLNGLATAGIPFAIVSNSDRIVVDANMRATELGVPGFISVSRNDVRNAKPHPEPYLRAAYLVGVDPADCIVVEDSLPGARAGLAAGMRVIGWPEPHRRDLAFPDPVRLADPLDLWAALSDSLSLSMT